MVSSKIGFRQVEIVGKELLINGQPVLIKGVNRHDHDHQTGQGSQRRGHARRYQVDETI